MMPYIELLSIIRFMHEAIGNKTVGKKFDSKPKMQQTVKITKQKGYTGKAR